MFAVVYLNDMQKHIVVPREFIFGISMQNLLNYGKNRHIQYKIYWSKNAFPDGEIPISDIKVNFDLDYCHSFPPDDRDECCYRGHIKYFFGKLKKTFAQLVNKCIENDTCSLCYVQEIQRTNI